jgi:hypothetical protein
VGKRAFGPIALGTGTPACPTSSPGTPLQCTITVPAPVGQSLKLTLTTYAKSGVSKLPLATGLQHVHVFPGVNYVTGALVGIARHMSGRLAPNALTQGQYVFASVVVDGIDAAGKVIPGPITNPTQVDVQVSGFLNANYAEQCNYDNCNQDFCCGSIGTFTYDGLATGKETIRTTSTISYNPSFSYVTVKRGNTALAPLLLGGSVQNGSEYATSTIQFAIGAAGDVPPVRATLEQSPLFGEDTQGNYWAGTTHYSNVGGVLGTIDIGTTNRPFATDAHGHIYARGDDCGFSEYAGGTYVNLKPMRTVTCAENVSSAAVDDAGNVYLAFESSSGTARILEYSPNGGSGNVPPIRTIATNGGFYASYSGLTTDAAGNLYATLYDDISGSNYSVQLYEFAPGATTGHAILPGVAMSAYGVDATGNLYVSAPATSGAPGQAEPGTIEEYALGSTTPTNIITGANTHVTNQISQIVLPR